MKLVVKLATYEKSSEEPLKVDNLAAPDGVDMTNMLSFLEQQLGDVIEAAWAPGTDGEPVEVGWVFNATESVGDRSIEQLELIAIPYLVDPATGELKSWFMEQSIQRKGFEDAAQRLGVELEVFEQDARPYFGPSHLL